MSRLDEVPFQSSDEEEEDDADFTAGLPAERTEPWLGGITTV